MGAPLLQTSQGEIKVMLGVLAHADVGLPGRRLTWVSGAGWCAKPVPRGPLAWRGIVAAASRGSPFAWARLVVSIAMGTAVAAWVIWAGGASLGLPSAERQAPAAVAASASTVDPPDAASSPMVDQAGNTLAASASAPAAAPSLAAVQPLTSLPRLQGAAAASNHAAAPVAPSGQAAGVSATVLPASPPRQSGAEPQVALAPLATQPLPGSAGLSTTAGPRTLSANVSAEPQGPVVASATAPHPAWAAAPVVPALPASGGQVTTALEPSRQRSSRSPVQAAGNPLADPGPWQAEPPEPASPPAAAVRRVVAQPPAADPAPRRAPPRGAQPPSHLGADAAPAANEPAIPPPAAAGAAPPPRDVLVAIQDATTIVVPDARGLPVPVKLGNRLPSGARLLNVDPHTGQAETDRGVMRLE